MQTNNENVNIGNLRTAKADTGNGISNPEIELGIPTVRSTRIPRNSQGSGRRTAADFSSLPEPKPVGVEIKKSIEDEILGEGGMFEDYMKEREKEINELYDAIDEHNRQVAEALGEEVPEDITDEDVERSRAANIKLDLDDPDELNEDTYEEPEYVDPLEEELSKDNNEDSIEYKQSVENIQKPVNILKPEPVYEEPEEKIDISKVSFEIDPEDMREFDEDEEDPSISDDENLKQLQDQITAKIAPISKKLNIASFTRSTKAVKAENVIKGVKLNAADWALMSAGKIISMKQFSGTDIDGLSNTEGLSRVSILRKRYKIFYDHIIGNKPKSLEEWLKSVSYFDNDHLYMTAFIATFAGSAYIPIDCPKCKNTFLTDNISIDDIYKFDNDEAEKRFKKIMTGQLGKMDETYTVVDVPVSERFCFRFREPSIYKMLFEPAYLDDDFEKKYRGIISVLSYIDDISYIDYNNQTLVPIGYKRFPANRVKDTKSKIIEYAKIINSLSPDEYNIIVAYINAISTNKGTITYQIPETICPKCGETIPARDISAEALVFMRHQLAVLATTSIK